MSGHTFTIHRDVDHSGVSGTGEVAEGWESSDGGTVVLKWRGNTPSVCIYSDIRHVELIHGHGGDTRIVFDSPRNPEPDPTNGKYVHDEHLDPRD